MYSFFQLDRRTSPMISSLYNRLLHSRFALLIISNSLFILLYLILAMHNRLAVDDFHFLHNIHEYSVFDGVWHEHESWSTRWVSVLLNHTVLFLHELTGMGLVVFNLFSLMAFTYVVYYGLLHLPLTSKAESAYGFLNNDKWLCLNLAFYIVCVIFFASISIDQTWFWLCSACTYLWSVIALCYGVTWVFSQENSKLKTIIGLAAYIYIGGSNGPLALLTITSLVVITLIVLYNKKASVQFKTKLLRRMTPSLALCLLSFSILYFGQGNDERSSFFGPISIGQALWLNGLIIAKAGYLHLPKSALIAIVGFLPLLSFIPKPTITLSVISRKLKFYTVIFLALLFFYHLPITYKIQEIAAERTLFVIGILTMIYVWSVLWLLSGMFRNNSIFIAKTGSIVLLLTIGYNSFQIVNQYRITACYAEAYDERIELLNNHKDEQDTLSLVPLPNSGLLYSAEISPDPSHFSNQHLRNGLQLKAQVKVSSGR